MKKFIAYITLGVALLASVAIGVIPTLQNINGDIDYARSRTYVYKISDRITDDSYANDLTQDAYDVLSDDEKQEVLDDVVDTFEDRLEDVEVTDYSITTLGYDTIEVTFKTDYELYDDVADLLTFSWSFMASTYGSEENLVLGDTASTVAANIANDSNAASVDYDDYVDLGASGDSDARFITTGEAEVEYKDGYPYVVVPLENPDGFKELYEQATEGLDDEEEEEESSEETESTEETTETTTEETTDDSTSGANRTTADKILRSSSSSTSDDEEESSEEETEDGTESDSDGDSESDDTESEEDETADENKIFILNDWLDNLYLEDFLEDGGTENISSSHVKDHVLFTLDCSSPSNLFWDYDSDADDDETYEEIYFGGYGLEDEEDEASYYGSAITDDGVAYREALIWCAKFNATTYKYQVSIINEGGENAYTTSNDPNVEYLVRNQTVTMSSLMIASIIAIVVLFVFMGLFFGLGGIMGAISISSVLLITLALFNALSVDFGLGAIIGMLCVTAICIFTVATYYRKIKNEIYLGKSFRKAYTDGGKKSFWYTLDFSVVGFVIGLITYLIPSPTSMAIGVCLLIGSVMNFVINGGVLRLISYLIYTSSVTKNHPGVLMIDSKLIPNLLNDEKPKYFDTFKAKTSKTSKKVYSIVGAVLLVGCTVGLITFQSLYGNIYAEDTSTETTVFVAESEYANAGDRTENTVENTVLDFQEALATITDEDGNSFFNVDDPEDIDVEYYYFEYTNSGATYWVYFFNVDLGDVYDDEDTSVTYTYYIGNTENTSDNLLNVFNEIADNYLNTTEVGEFKDTTLVLSDSASLYTLIGVAIALGVIAVYFSFRFGLARGLVSILLVGGMAVISVGLISLIRAQVNPIISFGAIFIIICLYMVINSFYIAEKEVLKENKTELKANRDLRYDQYEWVINITGSSVFFDLIICAFPLISLFFASGVEPVMILMMLVGMLVGFMFIKVLQQPYEFKVEGAELAVRRALKPVRKQPRIRHKKDDEPEESIYPGIND